jgi:hypothetical protein
MDDAQAEFATDILLRKLKAQNLTDDFDEKMKKLDMLLNILTLQRQNTKRKLGETDDDYKTRVGPLLQLREDTLLQAREYVKDDEKDEIDTQLKNKPRGNWRNLKPNDIYSFMNKSMPVDSLNKKLQKLENKRNNISTKTSYLEKKDPDNLDPREDERLEREYTKNLIQQGNWREQETIPHRKSSLDFSPMRIKCKSRQTRNRSTGRCRKTPCRSGKTLDVNSGLCRKKKSSKRKSPSRKSCRQDQVRNRSTGRCRNKSPSRKSRKPCRQDQVRNRSTSRCRKRK